MNHRKNLTYNGPVTPERGSFGVGRWIVRPERDEIEQAGNVVKLEPRLMRVLVALAARAGEPVSRKHLLEEVWSDAIVGDEALTQAISALRRHLGDSSRKLIQTIPKKGYRLIAGVPPPAVEAEAAKDPLPIIRRDFRRRVLTASGGLLLLAVMVMVIITAGAPASPRPVEQPSLDVVTAFRGRETDPAVSPDGRRVAFVWNGDAEDRWDLYLQEMGRTSVHPLTRDDALELSPAWSPDGGRLAYARVTARSCGIFVRKLTPPEEVRISRCDPRGYPQVAWSPRGDLLAISDSHGPTGRYSIILMHPDGTHRRMLTPIPQGYGDRFPAFAPDGSAVAFIRTEDMGASDVYVAPLAQSAIRRLSWTHQWMQGLSWLEPDRIIVAARRRSIFSLWSLSPEGGQPESLGIHGLQCVRPTRAGHHALVFEQQKFDSDIWSLSLRSKGSPARLIGSTQWEDQPRFSPDGDRIAYVSHRSGAPEIWVSDRDGRNSTRLTALAAESIRTLRWSPDGSAILFAASRGKRTDLYLLNPRSRALRLLTRSGLHNLAPAWSADGKRVFFVSDRDTDWAIWMTVPGTRSSRRIATIPAGSIFAAPDESLYFSRMDHPGIWRLNPHSSDPQQILSQPASRDWANWELRGDRLYYLLRENGPRLEMKNLQTGLVEQLGAVPMAEDDYGLTVDPREGTILFSRGDRTESDLVQLRLSPPPAPARRIPVIVQTVKLLSGNIFP